MGANVLSDLARRIAPANSARVGAWATSLGAIFGIPAAVVACIQAWSASSSASEAQKAMHLAKQQVAAAQEQVRIAREQTRIAREGLAQSEALVGTNRALVHSAEKSVGAAEQQAGFAGDFARSARVQAVQAGRQSFQTQRLADVSQERFLQDQAMRAAAAEPKIKFRRFEPEVLELGKEPRANVTFDISGEIDPTDLKSWVSWDFIDRGKVQLPMPGCLMEGWDPLGAIAEKSLNVRRSNRPLTPEEWNVVATRKKTLIVRGAICYKDSRANLHRANWCVISNGWEQFFTCPWDAKDF